MKRENDSYVKSRINSFKYAFKGISHVLKESNFRIHLIIAAFTAGLAFKFQFDKTEWIILLICIFFILCLEAINTALEHVVDLISPEQNRIAGVIKDIGAASVLIGAIGVAIIGLILYLPHFRLLF